MPSDAEELTRTTIAPQPTVGEGEIISTIYTTAIQTIIRCPDEVKNCPNKDKTQTVVTETYIIGTTICPIEDYPQPTAKGHFDFSASIPELSVESQTVVTSSTVIESQTYVWTETSSIDKLPTETPVDEIPEVPQPAEEIPTLTAPVQGAPQLNAPVDEPVPTTPVIEDVVVIVTPVTEESPAPTIDEPEVPEAPAETPDFETPVFTGAADKLEAGAITAVFAVGLAIMWDM